MDVDNLIAIDMHTHLEVSCRNSFDNCGEEYDRATDNCFGSSKRPTMDETVTFCREKKIGFVNFTVDAETQSGRRYIPQGEIVDAARASPALMIAFGSFDPHKGRFGTRDVRRHIEQHGVKGFKLHTTAQRFEPANNMAGPLYALIAEQKLPAIFHSGHSGIGSGLRCGGGCSCSAATRSCKRTWRSPSCTCRSAWAILRGRGRTKRSRCRCTSRTSGSTCRADGRNVLHRRSCCVPTGR